MVILVALLTVALLAGGPAGRPAFYWGARPAVIVAEPPAEAPLTKDFKQEVLWRSDGAASPPALSWREERLQVRLPGRAFASLSGGRMVLAQPGGASVGRLVPFSER